MLSTRYDIIDRSLDRELDSDNLDYVYQRIRDKYIKGTSCTVVLCGTETYKRKFVDWEIKATLDMQHGLIGVFLPENIKLAAPDRFCRNAQSGYALYTYWENILDDKLCIQSLVQKSKKQPPAFIVNYQEKMQRNLS